MKSAGRKAQVETSACVRVLSAGVCERERGKERGSARARVCVRVYVCVRVAREALRGWGLGGQGEDDRTADRLFVFGEKAVGVGDPNGDSRCAPTVVPSPGHGSCAASCLLIAVSASVICFTNSNVNAQCQTCFHAAHAHGCTLIYNYDLMDWNLLRLAFLCSETWSELILKQSNRCSQKAFSAWKNTFA